MKPEARFEKAHRNIEWAIGDLIDVTDESVPNQSQYFAASRAKKGNGQGDENNHKDKPAYTIRANPKSRVESSMQSEKLDRQTLQEQALSVFDKLREKMKVALSVKAVEVLRCVNSSSGEQEETVQKLVYKAPNIITPFQNSESEGYDAIDYVPPKTLVRVVKEFPEDLFDGKVFAALFARISLSDSNATERLRGASKDRIVSLLNDVLRILTFTGNQKDSKNELTRASLSIKSLLGEIE